MMPVGGQRSQCARIPSEDSGHGTLQPVGQELLAGGQGGDPHAGCQPDAGRSDPGGPAHPRDRTALGGDDAVLRRPVDCGC
jgi:hypothetical protein